MFLPKNQITNKEAKKEYKCFFHGSGFKCLQLHIDKNFLLPVANVLQKFLYGSADSSG